MKKLLPIIIIVLVLAGGGYFVMKSRVPKETAAPTIPQEAAMPAPGEGGVEEMVVSNVKEFTIDAKEFVFDVKKMNVKVGDTVRVTLTNSGEKTHDWVVDELNVRTKQIASGETDMIEFVPDKAGEFEFYCSVGQHRANGMVGTLVVEE